MRFIPIGPEKRIIYCFTFYKLLGLVNINFMYCFTFYIFLGLLLAVIIRHVLRKALEFEVKGKRKQGRPKKMWKTQVEESKSVGLEEDALNRARWRVGVGEIAVRVG